MELRQIGVLLLLCGGLALIGGVLLLFLPRSLSWFGHLPGDLRFELGKQGRLYIPLGTSLVISLGLSLLLTYLPRLLGR